MRVCVCPALQLDAKRRKDLESVVKVLAKAMAAVERARQVCVYLEEACSAEASTPFLPPLYPM
jgi:hypothetical protein